MNATAAFVLGLLVGWVIEWIIDWLYWRRKQAELRATLNAKIDQVDSLEAENALQGRELQALKNSAGQVPERTHELEKKLAEMEANTTRLNTRATELETENARLRAQAAAWESENAARAARSDMVSSDMSPAAPLDTTQDELAQRSGTIPAGTGEGMPLGAAPVDTGFFDRARDDLEVIRGIGPVIAGLLYQHGIYTFQQLSEMTPQRLRELVGDRVQRLADEESIIEQARTLAASKNQGV